MLRYLSQYESSIEPIFRTLLVLGPGENEPIRGGDGGDDSKHELLVAVAPLDTEAEQSFKVVRTAVGIGCSSSSSGRRCSLPREMMLLSGGGGSSVCCKLLRRGRPSPSGGSMSMLLYIAICSAAPTGNCDWAVVVGLIGDRVPNRSTAAPQLSNPYAIIPSLLPP